MTSRPRIRINRVFMTGPEREPQGVEFHDGVTVVWGPSNSGKSFTRKAIDFVLGSESSPTVPKEGAGYDNFILWVTLPKSGAVSLRRSTFGGQVYKTSGHLESVDTDKKGYRVLKQKHTMERDSISGFLLDELDFRAGAKLLKNERGNKLSFSMRVLSRYFHIDETRMIDAKSVILDDAQKPTTTDKGLIKFLLTGVDGSSIEPVGSADQRRAARDAKVQLLTEMVEELQGDLDETLADHEVRERLANAERHRDDFHAVLMERQDLFDTYRRRLREKDAAIQDQNTCSAELKAMVARFVELRTVLDSDLERLAGLEEGGFLLQRFANMNCPVCGATPEHQSIDPEHDHGLGEVETQRVAIKNEMVKIFAEAQEVNAAILFAEREIEEIGTSTSSLREDRTEVVRLLQQSENDEVSVRSVFGNATETVAQLEGELMRRDRISRYEADIQRFESEAVNSRRKAEGLDLNINLSPSESNDLSKVIRRVLKKWNYPGADQVHFDSSDQDIVVDGNRRRDNGAGVRAILHSAFKVAVLVYCQENQRPHPGFIILDSPLLAYRPADENRYGALSPEEVELKEADLATHFYRYLNGMAGSAQFIVIENHRADPAIPSAFPNVEFTLQLTRGRIGFFH